MRILIVDDDYVTRAKLKAILSDHGDCDAAPNGELALSMLEDALNDAHPYDLVTMDVDMPGMTGEEVVREIRQREWNWAKRMSRPVVEAKVLMVTVRRDSHTVIASFRRGCEGYLAKPVTPEKLRAALARLERAEPVSEA